MNGESPEDILFRHEVDLYRGDSVRPGLTTRMLDAEKDIRRLNESEVRRRDDWKKIMFMFFMVLLSSLFPFVLHLLGKW